MFDVISFKKLLEVTADDLAVIKENLGAVYMDETVPDDVKLVALAQAFETIDSWSSYFSRFKEIQESKLDELNRANAILLQDNKRLTKELNKLREDYSTQLGLLNKLQATVDYQNKLIEIKNNNDNMLPADLVEMVNTLEETISLINEHSSKIINSKRVTSGNFKPAMRVDVSDEVIAKEYMDGMTPNAIAKQFGMTQPAIIYRLKKLGIYVEGGRNNKQN